MRQHVHDAPTPVQEMRRDVSPALAAVVMKAIEKDPGRRFRSASEMAAALGVDDAAWLNGLGEAGGEMRRAALEQKAVVRQRYGYNAPFYWGAFVFLGER